MLNERPIMQISGKGDRKAINFKETPRRVISLVPSMTESMFDLGFGHAIVGITDYCIHPIGQLDELPRLGGPKDPNIEAIVALNPDLILANQEENDRQFIEALEAQGAPVWLTFPKTVRQSLDLLWMLAGIFRSPKAAAIVQTLEVTLDWAIAAAEGRPRVRYFCPIWFDDTQPERTWWMTFNRDTYSHDLLRLLGGQNVFADRERRYPLEAELENASAIDPGQRDTRYPRLTIEEVISASPDLIILPDEPYPFGESHLNMLRNLLAGSPAAINDCIYLVDGSVITWSGTRMARALQELPGILAEYQNM